jgi:hypothetical protein
MSAPVAPLNFATTTSDPQSVSTVESQSMLSMGPLPKSACAPAAAVEPTTTTPLSVGSAARAVRLPPPAPLLRSIFFDQTPAPVVAFMPTTNAESNAALSAGVKPVSAPKKLPMTTTWPAPSSTTPVPL